MISGSQQRSAIFGEILECSATRSPKSWYYFRGKKENSGLFGLTERRYALQSRNHPRDPRESPDYYIGCSKTDWLVTTLCDIKLPLLCPTWGYIILISKFSDICVMCSNSIILLRFQVYSTGTPLQFCEI